MGLKKKACGPPYAGIGFVGILPAPKWQFYNQGIDEQSRRDRTPSIHMRKFCKLKLVHGWVKMSGRQSCLVPLPNIAWLRGSGL